MTNEVRFIDTTVRDGNQSLWALNMRVGAMLPNEQRTFTLSVEMNPASAGGKRTWH